MSHLERALQVDVPYPCLMCGINLEEGVLYCPVCWAQKRADREARRVLSFDPSRVRRSPTVRVQITRHEGVESLSGAPSSDRLGHVLPSACLSGPVSAVRDPDAGRPDGGVE
jgi:hypothetical protein